MLYIVHGEDLPFSRNTILNQQKKLQAETRNEVSILDISPIDLQTLMNTTDLFGQPAFVVLDVTDAGRTNVDEYIKVLEKHSKESTVIILSAKSLSKSNAFIKNAKSLGARVIQNEKRPTGNVFNFIDSLFSLNRRAVYKELENLEDRDTDPFYLISMISYGLRNVADAKFKSPRFEKASPFIKGKAERQSQAFTEEDVVNLFGDLYKIDRGIKTGELAPDIAITYTIEKVLAHVRT